MSEEARENLEEFEESEEPGFADVSEEAEAEVAPASEIFEQAAPGELVARAAFPKGKEPRYAFQTIIAMLPEAELRFTSEGVVLAALDPSKTALIELRFDSAALEEYRVARDEVRVGLLFTTLKDVIKRIKATNRLVLGVDEASNSFLVEIYPKKGTGYVRRFYIPIVAVAEEEVPEIDVVYDATVRIDSGVLDDVIAVAEEISDVVELEATPDAFIVRAVGETRELFAEYPRDSEAIIELDSEGTFKARYSSSMLRDITRNMKSVSKTATLRFGDGKPLRISYEFSTGSLSVTLAPRVD